MELERECEEKLELLRSSLRFMTSLSDEKHHSISKPDPVSGAVRHFLQPDFPKYTYNISYTITIAL